MFVAIKPFFRNPFNFSRKTTQTIQELQNQCRFFSKVYRFKERYPELYNHVHPDSKYLFEEKWIGSGQKVKWICEKGPDHVWESDVASRIRAYNHSKKCVFHICRSYY